MHDLLASNLSCDHLCPIMKLTRSAFLLALFSSVVFGAETDAKLAGTWVSYRDGDKVMMESLIAFKRAGCAGVLTYFAVRAAKALTE